ncbi:Gamma-aminobutyric acid receptor subunit beta-like protein [Dinothrombium tinctorium]|uniref:Gamma-aminobutyric acid receptor subunit beta-like protein n=1 Tax=Dinothrombium tinctorium TaxID=1965070 RepID=A0A3S3P2P8_9ACAR|nr:Gamma-aminobutyric acid receptor subunit beta-like protein [Dinothrombium tinctorium]RWS03878.1 Gamma-aminobutyric acid receptor subunit beta-like protein [Dinothrombium tinctorium]
MTWVMEDRLTGGEELMKAIWTPDTFFVNALNVRMHNEPNPQVSVKINRDGEVLLSQRLTASIKCPQHLETFSCDTQTCMLEIESCN